jgi:osmotically-inducible protein OsmY
MHDSPTFAIHEQAVEAIARNPHLRQRRVSLRTHSGAVTLCGQVQSFYEKQMAQESLRDIPGIKRIENRLEVRWTNSLV